MGGINDWDYRVERKVAKLKILSIGARKRGINVE